MLNETLGLRIRMWTREGADPRESGQRIIFWVVLYSAVCPAMIVIEINQKYVAHDQVSAIDITIDALFGLWRFFGGLRATKRVGQITP